jgi:hypothetical protein
MEINITILIPTSNVKVLLLFFFVLFRRISFNGEDVKSFPFLFSVN